MATQEEKKEDESVSTFVITLTQNTDGTETVKIDMTNTDNIEALGVLEIAKSQILKSLGA